MKPLPVATSISGLAAQAPHYAGPLARQSNSRPLPGYALPEQYLICLEKSRQCLPEKLPEDL